MTRLLPRAEIALVLALLLAIAVAGNSPASGQRRGSPMETVAPYVPTVENLIIAAVNDRVHEVEALLKLGMDPNIVGRDGMPVLVTASREGSARSVDVLLAAGAKVDQRNPFGDNALMLAALKGHLDIVKKLLARGAVLESPGWTPLIYAATGGHDAVVKYLLQVGANIEATAPNGSTALMMAVREQQFSTAELLMANGANVNARNADGATALAWAERSGDQALVQRLKRAGAR